MKPTRTQFEAVLHAAEGLLEARAGQMVSAEEWDALDAAVSACREPRSGDRQESFAIDASGALVRSVVPVRGEPYQHRCDKAVFEAVAHLAQEARQPFTIEDLHGAANAVPGTNATWTQVAVAYAFLRERGILVPAGRRRHAVAGADAYLDAMTEYHALREKGPGGDRPVPARVH